MIIRKRSKKTDMAAEVSTPYGGDALIWVLGGGQVLSVEHLPSDLDKGNLARRGIPKQSALQVQELLGITGSDISRLLDISYRTFQRKKPGELLGVLSSEHLIEIAEVLVHAYDVFRHREVVLDWLHSPLPGLGGQKPIDLLDTSFGIRAIHRALGSLEHGIYA